MKFVMTIALVLCAGLVSAGELAPTQKNDFVQKEAFQKSSTQKGDAVQKSYGGTSVRVGFFGRRSARSCRSGSCG